MTRKKRPRKCPLCGGETTRPSLEVPGTLNRCAHLAGSGELDPDTCCECCEKRFGEENVPCLPKEES